MIAKRIVASLSIFLIAFVTLVIILIQHPAAPPNGQTTLWSIASQLHAPGDSTTQTVADSTVSSAWIIRDQIARMLKQGFSRTQILQHMQQEYGPSVLADPAWQGVGTIAWVLPIVSFLVIVLFTLWVVRIRLQRSLVTEREELLDDHLVDDPFLDKYI